MQKETSCGIVVYFIEESEINYLILQYKKGHWDLPKGHEEPGETKKQTALRETKEETGLVPDINEDFEETLSYNILKKGVEKEKTVYFFIGEVNSKEVKLSHEHIDYKWLNYKGSIEQLTYNNAKKIVQKANLFLVN